MKEINVCWQLLVFLAFVVSSCGESIAPKVLVFSKTEGFRHESIPEGIDMIKKMGDENGFEVNATEDAEYFTSKNLKKYQAIVFLSTTGDILDPSQELAFKRFIQGGGGFVGIHAAADTEYEWPWYGEMVGGYFMSHPNNPNVREAIVNKTEHSHESTDHLPENWKRNDEWYDYKSINPEVTTLLTLDESSYEGGKNGDFHPTAWYHEYDGGRAFYTGGGHTKESFVEELFVEHVWEGLKWAMGDIKPINYNLPTVIPEENRFVKEELDSYFNEPMELDLLPDGTVVFIERKGAVKIYDPEEKETKQVAFVEAYTGEEDGLLGLAVDPNYAENKHIFLCYSNPDQTEQRISRFKFDPEAEDVLSDEVVVLVVETQREECCHSAGALEIDKEGHLWASFGDNTNPHQSSGYAPIDERPGRYPYDAQKSSANTNDLRGGIIRIKVNEDGSYSIPEGNLFAKDGSEGRPEIYVMGCRNPYRFSIDSETGNLYWGDVGPDAREDDAQRGARGHDEVNQAKGPGFFGWPYFIGDNKPYVDYDFAAEKSLEPFDTKAPINDSPNNTGARELPPAQPAMVWYPYAKSEEFPLMKSGGRNAMAGPIYHYDEYTSPNRFPEYYDDKFFMYDWMRGSIWSVTFDENGDYKSMEPFLPSTKWNNLIDIVMTPEGDMYTLEYGTGWFTANQNAILSKLHYIPGNRVPEATFEVSETAGGIPFTVDFDATDSKDYDGDELTFTWDFGDGSEGSGVQVTHVYEVAGEFKPTLTVTDKSGSKSKHQIKILSGNTPPDVAIMVSGNKDFYFPEQGFSYEVVASDAEDGQISPDNIAVTLDYLEMGHDMTSIAQGHMALSEIKASHPGIDLISKSDCVSCHKVDGKSIGPSYVDVSNKYKDRRRSRTISYIAEKIIKGGSGVWGETAMAAHPDIKPKDAATIAEYIVEIARKKPKISLPIAGTQKLEIPKGKNPGGKFVVMASYTDKGANEVEPLQSFQNIVLRTPQMSATEFIASDKASKFTVSPDMMPGVEEEFEIVIVNDESQLEYGPFDLTGLSAVTLVGSAPAMFAAGGSMTLHIDDSESDSIGEAILETTMAMGEASTLTFPLTGQTGKHKLIFKFFSNKEGSPVGTLMQLIFSPMPAM